MSDILRPPSRFVSLHSHSHFSNYDGLGAPQDHIDFCIKNQLDGWALTDHGNGNGLAHAHGHAKKLYKKGQKFRQIFGVEFYFVPSLKDWRKAYDQKKVDAESTKSNDSPDEEEEAGLVVEDADETRSETSVNDVYKRYHLVVVAKNRVGLSNLFTLVKKSFKDGFYKFPRIDFDLLKQHGDGLVVSTACVGGYASGLIYNEFPSLKFNELTPDLADDPGVRSRLVHKVENMTDRFVDCVGLENFFLELQFHAIDAQDLSNRILLETSKKTGIPLVATADSHFPGPDLWEAREMYRMLQPGRIKNDGSVPTLPKKDELKALLYPKNAEQMWQEFLKRREKYDWYQGQEDSVRTSIENGYDVAWDKCEQVWFDSAAKLPKFDTPEKSSFEQLHDIVKTALVEEGFHENPVYVERVKLELSDIEFLKFSDYFLTLQKVFKVAENRTLPGVGRGSGAGSLVNYLLGITHIDPIKYNLLWERFLHRAKAGWPDIDCDVGNRDELIKAAQEIFGEESVVPVSNFNTLKLKSLVKDISKFYQISFDEVNAVTGPLEEEVAALSHDPNMEKSMFVLKHEDCMKHSSRYNEFMTKYPQVEDKVKTLFMMNRSVGRHAGGVLICPELEKHMPLITVRGELQTPWTEGVNIRNLEDNGFLKFDFLGLAQMQMVEDCIRRVLIKELKRTPTFEEIKQFYDNKINSRYVEPNDPKVFQHVFKEGRWPGIFQFTSPGARKFCLEAQPDNIEELAAITAIYRPGPLKANVHKQYVEAKKNPEGVVYDHPVIKEILGKTYGFIVMQEHFMLLAQKLAGFSPGESDAMRKTLVKKDLTSLDKKADEKLALAINFIDGCVNVSGLDRKKASDLFDKIAYFSLYGFNSSHAVSYAIDSYYGAWLSTYYPQEWLATVLQTENGSDIGLAKAINEIREMGYTFAKVDINYSGIAWTYSNEIEAFVPPLAAVKGIGRAAAEEIMEFRPFKSLDDMLFDKEGAFRFGKVNRTCLMALCKIEAFDSLEDLKDGTVVNYNQLLQAISDDKNYGLIHKGRYGITSAALKKLTKQGQEPTPFLEIELQRFSETPDWSRAEKIQMSYELTASAEVELLFPTELMRKLREKKIEKLTDIEPGTEGIGWCCIQEIQRKKTKNGKPFMRVKIIDDESRSAWLRIWGKESEPVELYTIWLIQAQNDVNWGLSTSTFKMKKVV